MLTSGSFLNMYYKRSTKVIFRDFGNFGYLTDNRNFGYQTSNTNILGDLILSKEGSIFFSALNDNPEPIKVISKRIAVIFDGVPYGQIVKDAQEFFDTLSFDGFVCRGESISECYNQDAQFNYLIGSGNEKGSELQKLEGDDENYEKYFGSQPFLSSVHINVSSKCNEHCVHCYFPQRDKKSVMDLTMFNDIIEQCRNMRVLNITISGGEPMLNQELSSFLRKCREYNFSVNLLSNLTLLNDCILEEISINPLLSVQTSLYSMNPTIHDSITGVQGSFLNTQRGIIRLWNNNVPVQINCPIMKQNKDSYEQVIDWAHSLNIEADSDYYIFGQYDHNCTNLECRLSLNEVKTILQDKLKKGNFAESIKNDSIKRARLTGKDSACKVCRNRLCISVNGDVYPCEGWQSNVLGNIHNKSLKSIWHSSKVNKLRNVRIDDFIKCVDCSDRYYCDICMLRNSNESRTGNPMEINEYFCAIAKMTHDLIRLDSDS